MMKIDFGAFFDMLPYLLLGMMGIFVVVMVIIAMTYGITILSTLIDKKLKKKKD